MPPKPKMAKATATRTTVKRKAGEDGDAVSSAALKKQRRNGPLVPAKSADSDDDDAGFAFTRTAAAAKPKKTFAAPTRSSPRNHAKVQTKTSGTSPKISRRPPESPIEPRTNGSDSFVAIPVSETPIIRKNLQLRQNGGDGRRRSSLSLRGKRASSMNNGTQSMPHPDVPSEHFFKLIDEDLPDPIRMKRLLAWCARRCIDQSKSQPSLHTKEQTQEQIQAANVARTIEEEVLRDLIEGRIVTSWYHRPDQPLTSLERKPHPQNVKNATKMKELQQRIASFEAEEATWKRLLETHSKEPSASTSLQAQESGADNTQPPERFARNIEQTVDLDLLPAHEAEFMHGLSTTPNAATESWRQTDDWLRSAEGNLEFQVDSLLQSLHQQNQFLQQAESKTTSLLEAAAKTMAAAESRESKESQARGIGTIDVLREISRAG